MYKVIRKVTSSQKKNLIFLMIVLIISLLFSSIIYYITQHGRLINIDYTAIKSLPFFSIFMNVFTRNILSLILIFIIALLGYNKLIYSLFMIISTFWGLSIIYCVKILQTDKLYLIFTLPDYIFYFPFLVHYSFISISISNYIKKNKIIETKSYKFDIITNSYIKLTIIYIFIVILYCLIYCGYLTILFKMLVG